MDRVNFDRAKLLQIECEMQGMIAENKFRESLCRQIAYTEDSFHILSNRIQELIDG